MLYPMKNVNIIKIGLNELPKKNIEVEENKALKKEELKEKIKRSKLASIL